MNPQDRSIPPKIKTLSTDSPNETLADPNLPDPIIEKTHLEHQPEAETPETPQNKTAVYTRILRWIGAATLGIAAICFLVSGWVDSSPLLRTGSFLGFTALLTGAGVFCTYRWRDDKGARTFMAIATAFLPANFAQLGAMIFAGHLDLTHEGFRDIFVFESVSPTALVITGLVSLIVLIPVAYLGFSALARSGAKKMTALYLLGNAALLLPWRNANLVAGLGFALFAGLVWADRKWFTKDSALKTWDGIAMRTLLFAPAVLFVIRNLVMYDITSALVGVIFALIAVFFFVGLPQCLSSKKGASASQILSYGFSFAAWFCIVDNLFGPSLDVKGLLPALLFLPWCMLLFGLSFLGAGRGVFTRGIASIIAFGVCWANLATFGGYMPSIICMLAAVALILAAFVLEEKAVIISGLGALGVGIAYHIHFALTLVQTNLWLSLAAAGTIVILASSYLERHGATIRTRSRQLRERWQGWK